MQTIRQVRYVSTALRQGRALWALITLGVLGLALGVAAACAGAVAAPSGQGERVSNQAAPPAGQGDLVSNQAAPQAAQVGQYFCYVETLTADRPSIYGYLAARGCQPSGTFKRGERLVFRFEALDISTGKTVTPVEAVSVKVRLPFLGDMDADFKQRGDGSVPDAPWTWDFCWDVPLDYPLGTLDYGIVISTKNGRSGVWKPPALVDPKRGIDSRPQIIE